ncbi:hypothetical protein GPECTOR_645g758 [Gonium pectorale]|uniref:Uncharacterized protein n=1 Tax=Gonium pectorale TaxID=33097 RepID=A0A150FU93_GONPE|nr:hypothetical protein GPECTOR_645g758 [Gonium pectorale]|eukprot:KXZ41213.1 hypothetical protein GPECTOR_645g758 [Gonium pectorale]
MEGVSTAAAAVNVADNRASAVRKTSATATKFGLTKPAVRSNPRDPYPAIKIIKPKSPTLAGTSDPASSFVAANDSPSPPKRARSADGPVVLKVPTVDVVTDLRPQADEPDVIGHKLDLLRDALQGSIAHDRQLSDLTLAELDDINSRLQSVESCVRRSFRGLSGAVAGAVLDRLGDVNKRIAVYRAGASAAREKEAEAKASQAKAEEAVRILTVQRDEAMGQADRYRLGLETANQHAQNMTRAAGFLSYGMRVLLGSVLEGLMSRESVDEVVAGLTGYRNYPLSIVEIRPAPFEHPYELMGAVVDRLEGWRRASQEALVITAPLVRPRPPVVAESYFRALVTHGAVAPGNLFLVPGELSVWSDRAGAALRDIQALLDKAREQPQ